MTDTIILLHGFPESSASWRHVTPLLTGAGYRVLAPDQRGYAADARPTRRRDYTLDKLASDVLALADAEGVERFHVVGHDWGGAVAWYLAANHAERVRTLTSLATPHPKAMVASLLRGQLLKSWYMLAFQLPILPELAVRGPFFRRQLLRSGMPDEFVDEYLALLRQPGAARGALNWYRALPFSPPSAVGVVRVPTLYVYGTDDIALGRAAADRTGDYVAAPYRYEVLDGVSHWIPEEVPERVAALVLDFIGTVAVDR
ncbi:MAG TPA: alpha/beta fold hydrolase [Acidimicrobiales bacterium]|nr:alpha/beta fold hydrolase [Acidimicrobiales bacterium]